MATPGPTPHDSAFMLAKLLLDLITTNYPNSRMGKAPDLTRDAAVTRWAYTVDKMQRIDGLEWGEIEGMIRWSQGHSYWQTAILGADNLREKWDQMDAQRKRRSGGGTPAQKGPTALALDELREIEAREREAAEEAAKEQAG